MYRCRFGMSATPRFLTWEEGGNRRDVDGDSDTGGVSDDGFGAN